ncbi:cytochrome c [Palleronia sp. LCG004]|uniref:c-type cytochrome n=1 Tax=Palleronia sp. LCG004 TaxID=3079304 RepID=UPI0029431549|nr:cytochrome c [Palleronia sp. LCG004]WOI55370.1 cytochrome c [Palleronia sp. LCG004]
MRIAFVVMGGGLAAVALWAATRQADTVAAAGVDLARGAAIYDARCAACHGAELEGQPDWRVAGPDGILPAPPHDETGHTWHHDDATLIDYTTLGGAGMMARAGVADFPSGMPAFGDILTEGEIRDVVEYIKSTWPAEIREAQAAR